MAETLLQKINTGNSVIGARAGELSGPRRLVVPYVHEMSNDCKIVVSRYGVPIVFSASNRLTNCAPE